MHAEQEHPDPCVWFPEEEDVTGSGAGVGSAGEPEGSAVGSGAAEDSDAMGEMSDGDAADGVSAVLLVGAGISEASVAEEDRVIVNSVELLVGSEMSEVSVAEDGAELASLELGETLVASADDVGSAIATPVGVEDASLLIAEEPDALGIDLSVPVEVAEASLLIAEEEPDALGVDLSVTDADEDERLEVSVEDALEVDVAEEFEVAAEDTAAGATAAGVATEEDARTGPVGAPAQVISGSTESSKMSFWAPSSKW